jgi:hypothetical protein
MADTVKPAKPELSLEQIEFILDVLQQPGVTFTLKGARIATSTADTLEEMRAEYGP